MLILDMAPRDRQTLAVLLLASACVTVGAVVAVVASGLAAQLGVFFATAGVLVMLANLGD